MPEPIEYRALVNLQAALAGIKVSAGYFYSVASSAVRLDPDVDAEALILENNGPRPFVLVQLDDPQDEYFEKPDGLRVTLPVMVHWIHETDRTVDADRLQVFLRGSADVERAIAPTSLDRSLGGLVMDTILRSRSWDAAGTRVWAIFRIDLVLHRTYGNPLGV